MAEEPLRGSCVLSLIVQESRATLFKLVLKA